MLELRKTKRPEDVLSAAGLEELTICDDPGPVFAKAEALTLRNAEVKKKLPRKNLEKLLDVPAATQTTLEITGFIAELDLDTADERLSALETEITDRLRELDEVAKLIKRRTLTPQDATMVQLRKLNVLEKQFAEVEKDFPDAVQAAEDAAFKAEGKSKVQPKMQQTASLKLAMTKAIKDWPTLPLATQLSNNGMGSVTYLLDRMLVLGKSPGKTVEQLAKEKQDAINTLFAAFKLDMTKRWGEYVQSNYHKNFRGPNPSPGIMTNEVKARCAEVQTVKVGSRTYVYSESVSEGNSMKTPLPPPWETNSNGDLIRSFIYHLKVG